MAMTTASTASAAMVQGRVDEERCITFAGSAAGGAAAGGSAPARADAVGVPH